MVYGREGKGGWDMGEEKSSTTLFYNLTTVWNNAEYDTDVQLHHST